MKTQSTPTLAAVDQPRLVRVYSYEAIEPDENDTQQIPEYLWEKRLTPEYDGKFLGWGQDREEHETGSSSYTCAIVEKEDGSVALVYAEHVQFIYANEPRSPAPVAHNPDTK